MIWGQSRQDLTWQYNMICVQSKFEPDMKNFTRTSSFSIFFTAKDFGILALSRFARLPLGLVDWIPKSLYATAVNERQHW